jgi:hypothetical protein
VSLKFETDCPHCDKDLAAYLPEDTKIRDLIFDRVFLEALCYPEDGGCGLQAVCRPKLDSKGKFTERWYSMTEL